QKEKGKGRKKEREKNAKSSTPVIRRQRETTSREDWFSVHYRLRNAMEIYREYDKYLEAEAEQSKIPKEQRTLLLRKTSKQLNLRLLVVKEIVLYRDRILSESGSTSASTSSASDLALVAACRELDRLVKIQPNPKTGRPCNKFSTNRAITFCKQRQDEREREQSGQRTEMELEFYSAEEDEEESDGEESDKDE
ncbi:hypothetical protein BGX24_007941, partial [Mortierella sp. AD032]